MYFLYSIQLTRLIPIQHLKFRRYHHRFLHDLQIDLDLLELEQRLLR